VVWFFSIRLEHNANLCNFMVKITQKCGNYLSLSLDHLVPSPPTWSKRNGKIGINIDVKNDRKTKELQINRIILYYT
jgi:hypothetical protein